MEVALNLKKPRQSNGHALLRLFSTAMKATNYVVLLALLFGISYGQFCTLYADDPWRTSVVEFAANLERI